MTEMSESEMESKKKTDDFFYELFQSGLMGILLICIAYAALDQTAFGQNSIPLIENKVIIQLFLSVWAAIFLWGTYTYLSAAIVVAIIGGGIFHLNGCSANLSQNVAANIEYNCPLCNEKTPLWCGDCNSELFWCETMGSVNSLRCSKCGGFHYPTDNSCSNCGKYMRPDTRFWTNRNQENSCNY